MRKKRLSVALAVINEGKNLRRCLTSLHDIADEIVVVDGGSSDDTIAIAKEFNAIVIKTDNPPIFHINKQKAIERARGEWILQMDADEELTDALKKEIEKTITQKSTTAGFYIARNNYFAGHRMRRGGTYPDYVIRLFKNGAGTFPCKSVHEQIEIDGPVGYLREPMNHYPYPTFDEYTRKADVYTSLTARTLQEQNVPISFVSALIYRIFKPLYTFINLYIRHRGFMDGWWGFVWAWYSGLDHAQAYAKYARKSGEQSKFSVLRILVALSILILSGMGTTTGLVYAIPHLSYGSTTDRVASGIADTVSSHLPNYRASFYAHAVLSDVYFKQAQEAYEQHDLIAFEVLLDRSHNHYTQAILFLLDMDYAGTSITSMAEWLHQIGLRHIAYVEPMIQQDHGLSSDEIGYFRAVLFKVSAVRRYVERFQ